MTERVQVDRSEIKVGDLIEVEFRGQYYTTEERATYRGVVSGITPTGVLNTHSFSFGTSTFYTFYRLPVPPPEEPKGIGAIVQVRQDNYSPELWVRTTEDGYPWYHDGDTQTWDAVIEDAEEIKVLSDGYTG